MQKPECMMKNVSLTGAGVSSVRHRQQGRVPMTRGCQQQRSIFELLRTRGHVRAMENSYCWFYAGLFQFITDIKVFVVCHL